MNVARIFSSLMAGALFLTMIFAGMNINAYAQDDLTPTPDPIADDGEDVFSFDEPAYVENGEADWEITDSQFINNYPDGFTFTGNAVSSGGPLVSVSVFFKSNEEQENAIRQRGDVDPETGDLVVDYSGIDADGVPPFVPINYRWRVSDESGTVYYSEWYTGFEYADDTREWTRLETDQAIVFIEPGLPDNIADEIFARIADAEPTYQTVFGDLLDYRPRIVLFANLDTFQEWRGIEAGAGGSIVVGQAFTNAGLIVQVLFNADDVTDLANTMVHEVTHLYQDASYQFRGPNWWTEGEATFFEFAPSYDYRARVEPYAESNQLPPLFEESSPLFASTEGPDGQGRWGYDVGFTFYEYIVDTYGFEAINDLYERLDEPEDIDFTEFNDFFQDNLEAVTGETIENLEADWRMSLGATAEAPTLIPTPTLEFRFPPTTTPFGQ